MQFNVLRERVIGRIRSHKEHERMLEFLNTAFNDKIGYSRPEPFKALANALVKTFEQQALQSDSTVAMTSITAGVLQSALAEIRNDTLVVAGDSHWSVNDVIQRLLAKGFEVKRSAIRKIPRTLNTEIGFWVQQELLGQEGIARGLDQRPEVKKQMEMWSQSYLADRMKAYARTREIVSEADIWNYLQFENKNVSIPQVQLRELRTSGLEEMRSALDELERGASFEEVIAKWSNDPSAKKNKGLTPFFPITERAPLGSIASQMEIGKRYGPVRITDNFYYFELVGKKSEPALGDTSFAAKKAKAAKETFELKYKTTISRFLSQAAEKRGFEIYEDRLRKLEVTTIPMMTFRLLGFGGRMFEVPFVDPQLDWLNIEPPKETILP
jgi:parvulin-like peptidyl-prolyl isomerase